MKDRILRAKETILKPLIFLSSFIIITSYSLSSCDKNTLGVTDGYKYKLPEQTDDGWEPALLESVGMDKSFLIKMMNELDEISEHRIHSIMIIKDGKLVFEEYFPGDKFNLSRFTGATGFDINDTHNLCSATKSFTSALIGIAIDKRLIQSTDQKVFDFFPEYSNLLADDPDKNNITLKHLLTMTSGIQWDDETYSYFDSRNEMFQLFNRSDPIRYILSRDLIEIPGMFYAYRNCNTNLLGEIIRKPSLQRLVDFAEEYLLSKLGITNYEWQMLPNDVVFCSRDLRLLPRDMAKFGYLILISRK